MHPTFQNKDAYGKPEQSKSLSIYAFTKFIPPVFLYIDVFSMSNQ